MNGRKKQQVNPHLEAALYYAARGWRVLPVWWPVHNGRQTVCACRRADCQHPGKHPLGKPGGATRGVHSATTDEGIIREWWSKWPKANIGIATGDGLTVIDVDPRNEGDVTLADLERAHGRLPDTVEVVTGGGGRHVYLQGNVPTTVLGPGLELKGPGSFVVAAPSLHASGRRYEWDLSSHPDDVAIAPVPTWLSGALRRVRRNGGNDAADHKADIIREGERNNSLTAIAGAMRRRGLNADAIFAALLKHNAKKCKPPLPEAEVRRIAEGMERYEPVPELPRGWTKVSRGLLDLRLSTGARACLAATVALRQIGKRPTGQRLAEALGVDRRSVTRWRAEARDAGIDPPGDPPSGNFGLVPTAALLDPALSTTTKAVLLAVASLATDRQLQLSQAAIARACGLRSERHVRDHLNALTDAGYVHRVRSPYRDDLGCRAACNWYRVQLADPLARPVGTASAKSGTQGVHESKSAKSGTQGACESRAVIRAVRGTGPDIGNIHGGGREGGTKRARLTTIHGQQQPTDTVSAHPPRSAIAALRDLPDDRLRALVVDAIDADRLAHGDPLYLEWITRLTSKRGNVHAEAAAT